MKVLVSKMLVNTVVPNSKSAMRKFKQQDASMTLSVSRVERAGIKICGCLSALRTVSVVSGKPYGALKNNDLLARYYYSRRSTDLLNHTAAGPIKKADFESFCWPASLIPAHS